MESKYRLLRILALVSLILAAIVFIWGLWNGLSWQGRVAGFQGLTAPGGLKLVLRLTAFFVPFGPALFFTILLFLGASGLQLMLDTAERTQALANDLKQRAQGS